MRKLILAAIVFTVLGGSIGTAQAHNVSVKSKKSTLQQQAQYYKVNITHAKVFLKEWDAVRGWRRFEHYHWVPAVREPDVVIYHRNLLRHSIRGLQSVENQLLLKLIPHKPQWDCIHSYEGDWEDGDDPYWGGLQMDLSFMKAHGSQFLKKYGYPRASHSGANGWLNAWTPFEQMLAAEDAFNSGRGFNPWPNTAHYCHLI